MWRDNSSIPNTCPLIDNVLDFLGYVHEIDDKEELIAQVEVFKNVLEEIREANKSLRSWGNELYIECDELKDDLKRKDLDIDDLKDEIRSLNSVIYELES